MEGGVRTPWQPVKVTGTNREVQAVVAASFAARTAASSFSR
jgi:hypothetical protein